MVLSKVVRLEPNKEQEDQFRKFAGTNRFAWNTSKAYYDSMLKNNGTFASISDLMKNMQDKKHNDNNFAWLNEVPEAITKQAMKDLLKAYKSGYKDRKKDKTLKNNPTKHLPKFKKRGKCGESFYQRTDNLHKTDDTHIKITGIKNPVKCKALKGIDLPLNIQNSRIKFDGKYWYLSYGYNVEEQDIVDAEYVNNRLGIDFGVKDLAITSENQHFANINKSKEICRLTKRLKRLQRQVSRKYEANATIVNGKKVFHKTNNIKKLEEQIRLIYRRISNIRKTYMYEVTKEVMKTKPHSIVIEDLNVKGMLQNKKLAKVIQDQCLYKFRQILTYKCQMNNIDLYIADRFYPSSKTCSCCGWYNKDLKLSNRTFICKECGTEIDRDFNAAINLAKCPSDKFKKVLYDKKSA